ncbi:fibrinogen C domain-containing protein 1-A [Aplysia californica]|uniref:Fibrinogen C domain-containing protein 1-A n=1 Tax=Aplysia californica TaxID=6500 RepID=A0ABM1VPB1_APLCA|nr:fibrinogen C domain-containing protein 1-A [Aplysia californica]
MELNCVSANILLAAALMLSSNAYVLNVTTTEVEIGKTKNVSLGCSNPHLLPDVAEIAMVRILKWENKRWNSVAEQRGDETVVKQNSKDIVVEASLGSGDQSFLRLTWPVATVDTVGRYRCDVIALSVQENVIWLKSQPVFISRKEEITVQMLSQIVEENRKECVQQLLAQKRDVLENVTATIGALEAGVQRTFKAQRQVLNDTVAESKRERLSELRLQRTDILQNVTAAAEKKKREWVQQLSTQKQDILRNVTTIVEALETSFESRLKSELEVWKKDIKQDILKNVKSTVGAAEDSFESKLDAVKKGLKPRFCADVQGLGPRPLITLRSGLQVVCDTETDNGGWILIQRRISGDVDFLRGWADYRNGFGDLSENFWLGLENIHQLTSQASPLAKYELRFDFAYMGTSYYAAYDEFSLSGELENYTIQISGFSGNVKDEMRYHNGLPFSTKDRDNDSFRHYNCAEADHGAWWYRNCHRVNFNGEWGSSGGGDGLIWDSVTGRYNSATFTEIKIRPKIAKC